MHKSQRAEICPETKPAMSTDAPTLHGDIAASAAVLKEYTSFDCLLHGFNELVKETVIAYEQCESINENSQSDPVLQMVLVGRFMALVGLLQSHMLAPQGPVDPVEKLRVQLEYAKKKVWQLNFDQDAF